jgi:hypothetical protein
MFYILFIENLIKAYFNKETLAEIHILLNNIDKLCYLIEKVYKTLYLFGQEIISIYYNILNTNSDLIYYVRKIGKFNFY